MELEWWLEWWQDEKNAVISRQKKQKWKTVKTEGRIIHHPSLNYFYASLQCDTWLLHVGMCWAALCCSVVVQEEGAPTARDGYCHFSSIFVSVLSLHRCMEDGTWCCGKEIRVFFLIIIYELSWISSVNRHLMMVEMFPNEPRSCFVWGNWPLLRPPKENWFKVKCQTTCSSPRALWIKLITRISMFGLEGSQGSVTWVCYPADPPPSGEITRVWYNHSWSCTRWEVESWWRLIIRPPTIFQYVTVGSMHLRLGEWILAVCSYVRNSRPESPPCLESLGKIPVGLSSGDSITLLVDFTVTWTMTGLSILISVVPAKAVKQLCSLWGVEELLRFLEVVGLSHTPAPLSAHQGHYLSGGGPQL